MSADQVQALSTCGCCKVEGPPTPEPIQNRPGLSSIHYRVGTYASFLLAMMEEIATTPELRERLLTRSTDDFSIALLAMWAYVSDILTFYQERIANEAYLRTALLQESVVRLAALLDSSRPRVLPLKLTWHSSWIKISRCRFRLACACKVFLDRMRSRRNLKHWPASSPTLH